MNELASRFFQRDATFEEVWILSEQSQKKWTDVERVFSKFPRGWFELSRVAPEDRVEFTRDYWLGGLPYHSAATKQIAEFFSLLDDVGVVLSRSGELWTAQLVYSLSDNSSFFRGLPPATDVELEEIKDELNFAFPRDWIAFMKIHNGFGKLSEFELLRVEEIHSAKKHLMEIILKSEFRIRSGNRSVDAGSLIPFYEAFGLSSFQCFFSDWYPNNEMGNVYFSGIDYTLSDISLPLAWNDTGAYASFLEWLVSYLEGMNIVQ